MECGDSLSSQAVASQVLSAQLSLTSVFGMRTGGSSTLSSPQWLYNRFPWYILDCHLLIVDSQLHKNFLKQRRRSFRSSKVHIIRSSLYWEQALDLLVSVSYIHYCTSTSDLSTLLSSRGLTTLRYGISYLEASFTLRCFQRLSHPHFATLLCRWHDNRCTIGAFIPVLSY